MKGITTRLEDGGFLVELDKEFYEKDAVFVAAYKFTEKCTVLIAPVGETKVGVTIKSKKGDSDTELEKLAEDFCNEVLDQQIRLDLERRYGRIREIIVQHAFAPFNNLKKVLDQS